MALPKVDYPVYRTTVPSTGDIIKFRPFNVREEKVLLTAMESDDIDDITNSLKEVISACTFKTVDPGKATIYDIEYLFLQIRMRSVSPEVTINFRNRQCPENNGNPCEKSIPVEINLEEVEVQEYNSETDEYQTHTSGGYDTRLGDSIPLDDKVGVTLKHPGIDTSRKIESYTKEIDRLEQTLFSCITSIYTDEETYTTDSFSHDELVAWYEELPHTSKEKMFDYIRNMPRLRKTAEFFCPKCEYREELVFEGLQSFFS